MSNETTPIMMKHSNINVGDGGTAKREPDLGAALDQGAKEGHHTQGIAEVLRTAARMAQESDLGRFLASGARLLSTQRARLVAAHHGYATGRAKLLADAERELQEFRIKTRERLRAYDHEQHELIAGLERDIERLEYMQEVTQ